MPSTFPTPLLSPPQASLLPISSPSTWAPDARRCCDLSSGRGHGHPSKRGILALRATDGSQLWRAQTGQPKAGSGVMAPFVSDGLVLFGGLVVAGAAGGGVTPGFKVLQAHDGTVVW